MIGRQEEKMGFRAVDTSELFFDDVSVSSKHLMGKKGQGMILVAAAMESSRLATASMALGMAETAYEKAFKYAAQRRQFGKPIRNMDAIQFYLADMATQIRCSDLLIRDAARLQAQGKRIPKEAAMAKYFTSEMAFRTVSLAMQIHGGCGYMNDFEIERIFRDVRLCMIIEGTNEIQKKIIAQYL